MPRLIDLALAALVALALTLNVSLAADKKKKADAGTSGTVKSVDAAANTITLAGKKAKKGGEAGPDQTITLAKDAKVTVDGKEAKLADVKAGANVTLVLSEDKKSATSVTVAEAKKKKTK